MEGSKDVRVRMALDSAWKTGMIADRSSARRAYSWLSRLVRGSDVDLRTNATKHITYEAAISEWDQVYKTSLSQFPESLRDVFTRELEENNRKNIGPKSVFKGFYEDGPDKLRSVLTDKSAPPSLDKRCLARAVDRLVAEIPQGSLLRKVSGTQS